MYVDLLTRALGTDETGSRSSDLLLAELVESRVRLRTLDGASMNSAAESLARELSYDGALIRLCESLSVPASANRFSSPGQERRRLEDELIARGVPLAEMMSSLHPV